MHEMSIARGMLTEVLQLAKRQSATAVEGLFLRLGEFAGVEPALLISAFDHVAKTTLAADVRVEIDFVPLQVTCNNCGQTFRPERFHFRCASCGGTDVQIISGEELTLVSIDVSIADEVPSCP